MKTIIFSILILFCNNKLRSQELIKNSDFIAIYDSKFKLGTNNEQIINYILIGGDDFSFSSAETFLGDFSPNYQINRDNIESNSSYIDDSFYFNNNSYFVFGEYIGNKIAYTETLNIQWKIENETKVINNVNCKKATTVKYGRNWIAYFSVDYPFPFGPYKFNGLPGLVFEIYDSNKDYHFVLRNLKNEKIILKLNLNNYKFTSKDKYFQTVNNLNYTLAGYPPIEDSDLKNKMLERLNNRKKRENNPIELNH